MSRSKGVSPKTTCLVCTLAFFLLFGLVRAEGGAIKDLLDAHDHEFLSSFRLDLLVCERTEFTDPMQGVTTATVTITGKDGRLALRWQRLEGDPLHYRPRSKRAMQFWISGRDDGDDRYDVSVRERMFIYLEGSLWKYKAEHDSVSVGEDSNIASSVTLVPLVCLASAGSENAPALMCYRYMMALGRGYGQLIDEATTVGHSIDGITGVQSRGHNFAGTPGVWDMEIEGKDAECLVRRAGFILAGKKGPLGRFESGGRWDARVPLGRTGHFGSSQPVLSVTLLDYSSECDEDLLRAVANEFDSANLPKGSLIMDWRVIDGDGAPLMVSKQ